MARTAIISVDGHVKAARAGYRDYIGKKYIDAFDEWLKSAERFPDGVNISPQAGVEAQWDSALRIAHLESQGVVAEVLFPNGLPFAPMHHERDRQTRHELSQEGRRAYNRWLVDFCAEAPGRRAGQALVSFDDVDQAVKDIHWAKAQGLRGISMPPLLPGGTFFFDPVLDPIWATCEDVGLPLSQHGGVGMPSYQPFGFASIMTMAFEHSFFSGRSLWQMILGGVFERFPRLKLAFVETEAHWIGDAMERLDQRLSAGDEWLSFAGPNRLERPITKLASEYWASNCYAGISPFSPKQISMDDLVGKDRDQQPKAGFSIGANNAMFGVDYPHSESIFPNTRDQVAHLVGHPSVSADDARKILFDNAAVLYGFDVELLQQHIDRVGFELSEVLAPVA